MSNKLRETINLIRQIRSHETIPITTPEEVAKEQKGLDCQEYRDSGHDHMGEMCHYCDGTGKHMKEKDS